MGAQEKAASAARAVRIFPSVCARFRSSRTSTLPSAPEHSGPQTQPAYSSIAYQRSNQHVAVNCSPEAAYTSYGPFESSISDPSCFRGMESVKLISYCRPELLEGHDSEAVPTNPRSLYAEEEE